MASERPPRARASATAPRRQPRKTGTSSSSRAAGPALDLRRVIVEGVSPEVDAGRFAAKSSVGERVQVEADVFTDGHDRVAAALLYRHEDEKTWRQSALTRLDNDRFRGAFIPDQPGRYVFTIAAWRDLFGTWAGDLGKRVDAGQSVDVDLAIGAGLLEDAAARAAGGPDADALLALAHTLRTGGVPAITAALAAETAALVGRHPDRDGATTYDRELPVFVDRERARFGAWYEMFPRSCAPETLRHGTFQDAAARLPYIADMGFDVVYLPPVHPIGRTHRKGPDNALVAGPDDPGSPWAIGGSEGGHKSVHPQLGTLADFDAFVAAARRLGLEVALDIAFQCSPDHPYVSEHPEWFRRRPDGTIQYAENPPKKYQDIYPFDFDSAEAPALWQELLSIVLFWLDHGVRIFRVDNPHTKPFGLWEWLIAEVRRRDPGAIFLSEAFTRPKVMYRLAKLGFTQSYTYFTWRRTAAELQQYFTELGQPPVRDFFRPSLWPNTPDILTDVLQDGGRSAFMARAVLASTLAATYGIYGPAFELGENVPREKGSEEYRRSEKYEIRRWDLDRPESLRVLLAKLNAARRSHAALQHDRTLRFHLADNPRLLCYSKTDPEGKDVILMVVNLDPQWNAAGFVHLDMPALGLPPHAAFDVDDLLTGARYRWQGPRNYVELDPRVLPAHVFEVREAS
jgi:starch synthase (maltosyl-transferring)